VSQLDSVLAGLGLPAATSILTGALGTLSVEVGSLPTGAALANLRTLGVDLTMGGLSTSVLHYRDLPATSPTTPGSTLPGGASVGSSTPGSSMPGSSMPGSTSGSPASSTTASPAAPATAVPQTSHGLPFTGADTMTDLALAAVLMLAGGHLVLLGRRRRQRCSGTLQAPARAF
jgi:LPXTG-motif cell wall-anchored protein